MPESCSRWGEAMAPAATMTSFLAKKLRTSPLDARHSTPTARGAEPVRSKSRRRATTPLSRLRLGWLAATCGVLKHAMPHGCGYIKRKQVAQECSHRLALHQEDTVEAPVSAAILIATMAKDGRAQCNRTGDAQNLEDVGNHIVGLGDKEHPYQRGHARTHDQRRGGRPGEYQTVPRNADARPGQQPAVTVIDALQRQIAAARQPA